MTPSRSFTYVVVPAKAGIHRIPLSKMDPRLREDDGEEQDVFSPVVRAKAGVHLIPLSQMDPRLRKDDGGEKQDVFSTVVPAKAGIHLTLQRTKNPRSIPACAGTTEETRR
jgi:hypothetical protein